MVGGHPKDALRSSFPRPHPQPMVNHLPISRPPASRLNRSHPRWRSWFAVLLAAGSLHATAGERVFRAGAYAIDITPTNLPVIVNGGFLSASATNVNDPLHARCLILDDGETQAGLCVIDTCLLPRELAGQAKMLIQQATGLLPERLLLSATHTHMAPSLMPALGTPADPHYPAFLVPRLVEGFRQAQRQLAPVRIGWAAIPAPDYTHTRVWIRRPDRIELDPFGQRTIRANMHPGHLNPDVIGPSGPSDPELSLVSLQSLDGRPVALLANYAMHYHGGTPPVSADYYGRFAEKLKTLLGAGPGNPPFVGIMSQGFSGDQHWMDYAKAAQDFKIDDYAAALARLAAEAAKHIQYHDWVPLKMRDRDLPLPVRMPSAGRLAWARSLVEAMKGRLPQSIPEVYAAEQLWLETHPVSPVKLQVLRLGELGITAVSGEVFALASLKLKTQSPLRATFNIELANGEDGYILPPENHALGGYNTWACRSACLEANAEPRIVEALLAMLEDVAGQPRRPLTDPPGRYGQAVLLSEPLGYWRLNEFNGPSVSDASRHHLAARCEPGIVFHLDGPASPALPGPGGLNRAIHLAGGRMLVPLAHPGAQYSVEFWFWNGLRPQVRGLTGHLFSWGDRLAIGGTNRAAGRLIFSNGGAAGTLIGASTLPLKQWSHLALTRDGSRVIVYLNGLPEIIGDSPPPETAYVRRLCLGGGEEPGDSLEGKLDEVAAYDRTLGAAEVMRHVQLAGLGLAASSVARVDPDPLIAYSAAVLDTQPMAYWRLGENGQAGRQALDSSAHNRHGDYEEAVELYAPGLATPGFLSASGANHAARFVGGRLRVPVAGLGPVYSVSLWFSNNRPNNQAPVTAYLFSRGPDGAEGAPGDHLGLGGTHLQQAGRLIFYNGNALGQVLAGNTVIQPGSWNHAVLVRKGTKVRVYLNGNPEPELEGETAVSPGAQAGEAFFGGRNDYFASLDGRLDELVLYDRELSSLEARRLFTASLAPAPAPGAGQPATP